MATGDTPDFEEDFWRREPFFGIVFFWLVNLLATLFLMNVFLSIIVDGYISANENKRDPSSILQTTAQAVKVRSPLDLGTIEVPTKQGGEIIKERGRLQEEVTQVLQDSKFSKRAIRKARREILIIINRFIDEQKGSRLEISDSTTPLPRPSNESKAGPATEVEFTELESVEHL